MKVKNGIASSNSLESTPPKMRPGMACRKSGANRPSSMPMRPKMRPTAPSENAAG